MKNQRSVLVLFTSALAVVVACGGSNSSEVFGGGTGDGDGGGGTDAMTGSDGTVADGATEGGGGNDGGGTDGGGTTDAAIDAEKKDAAVDPATLCTSTGGMVSTSLCCKSAGDFPDTCKVGACGCAPTSSHTVQSCLCPLNDCFDAVAGCRAR